MTTRERLLAAGVPPHVIDNDLKTGRYWSVHRGVYARGPLSPRGRLVAALLLGGDEAALSHASALLSLRLLPSVVTVDVAVPRPRRPGEQVRFHTVRLADDEVTRRDGLRATTIERTLFDIAATGAEVRKLAQEALAKRLTTRRRLSAFAERHKGERGAPALRRIAGEPHTRSDLERRFRRFLDDHGLPQPEWNHALGPYDVDCYWPQYDLVIARSTRPPTSSRSRRTVHATAFSPASGCAPCASPNRACAMRHHSGRRSDGLRESFADE